MSTKVDSSLANTIWSPLFTTSFEKAGFSSSEKKISFSLRQKTVNIFGRLQSSSEPRDRKSSCLFSGRFSMSLRTWCLHPGGSAADYNVTAAASSSSHNAEGHSANGIFPLALPRFISNIKVAIDRPGIDSSARLRRAADERAKWGVKSERRRDDGPEGEGSGSITDAVWTRITTETQYP